MTDPFLKFRRAISEHRKAKNTLKIRGNYRGQTAADFYLDPNTGLLAVYDKSGNFITAYKASQREIEDITKKGFLW